ncbi:MAG TPA: hypothetical protein VFE12_09100 [Acetobacteraceae bacterium]|nr:hypothetical protein [Acetobacteraceae bacterium]
MNPRPAARILGAMPQHLSRRKFRQWAAEQPRGRWERVAGTPIAMAPKRCTVHASPRARIWRAPDPPVISLGLDEIYGA